MDGQIKFKNGILCWDRCPNCDALLPQPVGIGDDWQCAECGEFGTRTPDERDTTLDAYRRREESLTPEQRLYNMATEIALEQTESPPARQLAEMVLRHLDGKFPPVQNDELPF